jgi:hypothetical protein
MSDTEELDYPVFGSYAFDQFVIVGLPLSQTDSLRRQILILL